MQTNRSVLEDLEDKAKRDADRGGNRLGGGSPFFFDGERVRQEPGPQVLEFLRHAPDELLDAEWPEAWNKAAEASAETPEPEPQGDGDGGEGEKSPGEPEPSEPAPETTDPAPATPETPTTDAPAETVEASAPAEEVAEKAEG